MSVEIQRLGNIGVSMGDNANYSFQLGDDPVVTSLLEDDNFVNTARLISIPLQWLNIGGHNIYARGENNMQCEEIEFDIKQNRQYPTLITKKVNMLYGRGVRGYYDKETTDNTIERIWVNEPEVFAHLEEWQKNGIECDYQTFALSLIKRFYTFGDVFIKHRISNGNSIGKTPIAGMEVLENKNCRLGIRSSFNPARDVPIYSDFEHILFGNWLFGISNFTVYPKFKIADVRKYRTPVVGHYRQDSVGEFYGLNETFEGTKTLLRLSNNLPEYLTSFLQNSLSAKVHIVIPNAWLDAQRLQMRNLCRENADRKSKELPLKTMKGIEIGTEFYEYIFVQYVDSEISRATKFLTSKKNQGKTFFSASFRTGQSKEEEKWRFETIDLKYSEYIQSLIAVDKRADEVLLSAFGLDASISAISQPGVISKSGADAYYNYIIYLLSLQPDEQVCMRPFNDYLAVNFPSLYNAGYRLGCHREMPARQSEVSTNNRLNAQQA